MGTAGSGGFVAGGGWWLLLVVVLLLGLIAVALILAARRSDSAADPALATLRERYAAGDLDDEAFDRRRERLRERTG
jgi:putative membrane protein